MLGIALIAAKSAIAYGIPVSAAVIPVTSDGLTLMRVATAFLMISSPLPATNTAMEEQNGTSPTWPDKINKVLLGDPDIDISVGNSFERLKTL